MTDAYGNQWEQGAVETKGSRDQWEPFSILLAQSHRDEGPGTEQVGKGPNPAPFMRSVLAGEESEAFLLRNCRGTPERGLCLLMGAYASGPGERQSCLLMWAVTRQ